MFLGAGLFAAAIYLGHLRILALMRGDEDDRRKAETVKWVNMALIAALVSYFAWICVY